MSPLSSRLLNRSRRLTLNLRSMAFATGWAAMTALAQDWSGAYKIAPANQTDVALEVVDATAHEGGTVSLGALSDEAKQRWTITPKGKGQYAIQLAVLPALVLAAAEGGSDNGTPIVLARAADAAAQTWSIRRNTNGTFSLLPAHAPTMALDDFGGNLSPGAKQDLWEFNPDDSHLQWGLQPLAGAKVPPPSAPTPAESVTPDEAPVGTLKEFEFTSTGIFPGTTRHCTVFIPSQYDGSKPACLYVQQDGYTKFAREGLASLIATKEMPVTIGLFVQPGTLPPPIKKYDLAGRRNRSLEYDGVGDKYIRFLAEELLPYVVKTYDLKLSDDPSDRCIAGASSGGIAAFNAAWERPDLFSRVYAASGSFVAFKGGNEFPTLIRQFEAKPIRTYLTTGTGDMVNCAGDWFLLDREIAKALQFSGYDYSFHVVNGGHTAGYKEQFVDAMRFLWKDWPQPVPPGRSPPRVNDIIVQGDPWTVALQGKHDLRSPACNSKGEIFFIDATEDKIYRLGLDGKAEIAVPDGAHAEGLAVGPHDELYTVSSRTGNVLCYEAGGEPHVYASGLPAGHVVAMPGKGLYVTSSEDKLGQGSKVWYIDGVAKTVVDTGLKAAAGLAFRPDQWLLSVADERTKWVYSYEITPGTGALINKERFFWLHVADWDDDAGPDAVCYSREGQLLVATRSGIQSCSDDGNTQTILPTPDGRRVTGVCLGGEGLNTLYAFCGDRIWKRVVKIHADGAFTPWTHVGGRAL